MKMPLATGPSILRDESTIEWVYHCQANLHVRPEFYSSAGACCC